MFLRHFSKLCTHANKYNRLPKVEIQTLLNTRTEILFLAKNTATVASQPAVSSSNGSEKSFGNNIGNYFLTYMLNNPKRYSVVNTSIINLEEPTNFKSLELLKNFLNEPEQTNVPEVLEKCFLEEVENYSFEEIYKFIILISNSRKHLNVKKLLIHFDRELRNRSFSDEELLKILFVIKEKWPKLLRLPQFRFSYKAMLKLSWKSHRLKPEHMVQLFLCIGKFPSVEVQKIKYNIQENVSKNIMKFDVTELAIIAEGFVRAGFAVTHSNLAYDIVNKAIEELDNMDSYHIFAISQMSLIYQHGDALCRFQKCIIPHIPKYSEACLIGVSSTGLQFRCMNLDLWSALADNFKKNIENYNITEINRILGATVAYNIQDNELLNLAINQVEAKLNLIKDFQVLISILYKSALHNLYPENLLKLILSENFISQFNPELFTIKTKMQYCFINYSLDIDKPGHNFMVLNAEQRKTLFHAFNIYWQMQKSLRKCHISLLKATNCLEELFGKKSVSYTNCLPHFNSGIVMRFDKCLKALPVELSQEKHYPKAALKDDNLWLFIMILLQEDFLYNSKTPVLSLEAKIRHLKALGYKPVLITRSEWMDKLHKRTESTFLSNLIIKNLEEISEQ